MRLVAVVSNGNRFWLDGSGNLRSNTNQTETGRIQDILTDVKTLMPAPGAFGDTNYDKRRDDPAA